MRPKTGRKVNTPQNEGPKSETKDHCVVSTRTVPSMVRDLGVNVSVESIAKKTASLILLTAGINEEQNGKTKSGPDIQPVRSEVLNEVREQERGPGVVPLRYHGETHNGKKETEPR